MAWTSITDVKAEIPELTGSGQDTHLTTLLAAAEAILARYCGYRPASALVAPTFQSATYTEYPESWQVEDGGLTLRLHHAPVTSITSIYDSPDRSYGSNDLVDSGDYAIIDGKLVRLVYNSTHGAFSKIFAALKVVYVAGWTTPPEELDDALIAMTVHMYRRQDMYGVQSLSVQGGSKTRLGTPKIPDDVKEKLYGFVLPGAL